MLASLLGIRLVLWLGERVPAPAPYEVMTHLQRVEVSTGTGEADGFSMSFALARSALPDFDLLERRTLRPMTRVIIAVVMGAVPEVLMDGVVTHHQLDPGNQPGEATLTVMGRDLTTLLDLEEKDDSFPNMPDFLIVMKVLANYAQYGLIPDAEKTTDVPVQTDRIPRQQETDLGLIRRLAERNGFLFFIEPKTFGVSTAYWGPEKRLGVPQPALSVNLGSATNVKSLRFSNDALAPFNLQGAVLEPSAKTRTSVQPRPPLRTPPLAHEAATPQRTLLDRESSKHSSGTAATRLQARTTRAPDAVTGNGELDSVRYGHVLRPRQLVGVRGAGRTYDGSWYVESVTHSISVGDYSQRFQLRREGTGALTPFVRV